MRLNRIPNFCAVLFLTTASWAFGQNKPGDLSAYANCTFPDGLQVVRTDMLPPGVTSREVESDSGPKQIDLEAGMRIILAYPGMDPFANVKAEILPAAKYAEEKGVLLQFLRRMGRGNPVNSSFNQSINGFEIDEVERQTLEGGVLGIYLFFSDPERTATTVYLLNQEPQKRRFQTMAEYRTLRDGFLTTYTACIQKRMGKAK